MEEMEQSENLPAIQQQTSVSGSDSELSQLCLVEMQKILAEFQDASKSILKELERSVEHTRTSTRNNQEIQATTQKQFDNLAKQYAKLINDLSNEQNYAVEAMRKGTNTAQWAIRKEVEKSIIEAGKTAQLNIDSVAETGKKEIEAAAKNIVTKLDKIEKIAAKKPNSQVIDLVFLIVGIAIGFIIAQFGMF